MRTGPATGGPRPSGRYFGRNNVHAGGRVRGPLARGGTAHMFSARIATSLVATLAISLGLAGAAAGGNGHGKDRKAAGPPVVDPAGVIDLPAGYSYDIIARSGKEPCTGDKVTSTESGGT